MLAFAVASVAAALFTRAWIAVALRLGIVDPPNPLIPQHRQPTAHVGGLAVVGGVMAGLGVVALALRAGVVAPASGPIGLLLAGGLGFLLLGALDDVLRLSARAKFLGQIALALAVCLSGLVFPFAGQFGIDVALSMLVLLTLVNAVNLTDVCDGLVAGLAAVAFSWVAITLTGPATTLQIAAAAAAGGCVGFLCYNAPPARVFLGDAGSHWVGYMLAALVLLAPPNDTALGRTGVGALIAGVFLFEILLLIASRLRRGVPVWVGSRDHFALRLQAAGLSTWQTVLVAWAAGIASGGIAYALHRAGTSALGAALALAIFVVAPALVIARRSAAARAAGTSSEPRRVLWIHQNFVTASQAGNSRPIHIVAALVEAGWAVDIVTTQSGYLEDGDRGECPRSVVQREGGLTIHRLRTRGGARNRALSWLSFGGAALIYLGQLRRVDVVYASTPPLPQVLIAMVAATVRRAPIVLEVRDLWPLFLERLGLVRSMVALAVLRWIEAAAYRAARHVVNVSPGFEPYLVRMGIEPGACLVAPTGGVDRADEGAARSSADPREFRVIYAGSFNEAYDIERLLAAAADTRSLVTPIRWIFAGGGRSRDAVVRASERLDNIVYAGILPKDELGALLETCHLGIVSLVDDPVIHRVIPGKLFDYWNAGLPVLCIAGGMPAAIVRAAEGGEVLASPNAVQVARAVEAFAGGDPAGHRAMGVRGRNWMRRHMPMSRSARAVAAAVGHVHGVHGGQSQALRVAWAMTAACVDVLRGRARRAAAVSNADDVEAACAAALRAWIQDGAFQPDAAPLRVPELLTARPVRSHATTEIPTAGGW